MPAPALDLGAARARRGPSPARPYFVTANAWLTVPVYQPETVARSV